MKEINYDYRDLTTKHSAKKSDGYLQALEEIEEIKGKTILDFGCGTGELLKVITKNNKVYGLDADKKSVLSAQKNGLNAKVADLNEKLSFQSNKFDIVIARDILEHLYNIDVAIAEIKRVIKKNGLFLLDLPNEFALDGRINVLLGKGLIKKRWFKDAEEWNNPHLRFYTRKGIEKLLRKNGFIIIKDISALSSYYNIKFLGKLFPQFFCGGIILITKIKKK